MKSISKFLLAFGLLLWGSNAVFAQSSLKDDEKQKADEVTKLVKSGEYTFTAEKLVADKGKHDYMRTQGDLDIAKDTLIAYLPDDGKSVGSPVRAMNAGLTCTKFIYHMAPGDHENGWVVEIKPEGKYRSEIGRIDMTINKEGYATVRITRGDEKPTIITGYIKEHAAVFPAVNRVAAQ